MHCCPVQNTCVTVINDLHSVLPTQVHAEANALLNKNSASVEGAVRSVV